MVQNEPLRDIIKKFIKTLNDECELNDVEEDQITSLVFNLINSDSIMRAYFFSAVSGELDILDSHIEQKKQDLLNAVGGKKKREIIN